MGTWGTDLNVSALPVLNGLCILPVQFNLLLPELMHVQPVPLGQLLRRQLHLLAHLGHLLRMLQLHRPHHLAFGHLLSAE